jgi:hypothetical protein
VQLTLLEAGNPNFPKDLVVSFVDGGRRAAILYTLIETAKMNDATLRLGSPTSPLAPAIITSSASKTWSPGNDAPPRNCRVSGSLNRSF